MTNHGAMGSVDPAQIPASAQRGLARLQYFFDTLDTRLAERQVITSPRFSRTDITAMAW